MNQDLIADVTYFLVWFGIPAFVIYRRPRSGERNIFGRFMLAVFGTWIGLIVHRDFIGLPAAMARAQARGDLGYDGIGGNIGMLFGGWMLGIFSSGIVLITFMVLTMIKEKRKPPAAEGREENI